MRGSGLVFATAMAMAFSTVASPASADDPVLPEAKPLTVATQDESADVGDRVIVQWEPDATKSERAAARGEVDPVESVRLASAQWQVLTLPGGESAERAAARLADNPAVRSAEPDFRVERHADATDPSWSSLWGLKNTGQKVGPVSYAAPGADIDASGAWDKTVGEATTTVAVIDDGYRFTHPDAASRLWVNPGETAANGVDDDANGIIDDVNGADFSGATTDGNPTDDSDFGGHGTHVAGTISATRNNAKGITGVAPGVRLMPLRVCGGVPFTCSGAALIAAINYAGRMGAKVVNISMGTTADTTVYRDAMAKWPNTLYVISAGNDNFNNDWDYEPTPPVEWNPSHPCVDNPSTSGIAGAIDNVICVAATNQADAPASFSNYGAATVDVAAPGTEILSTSTNRQLWSENFEGTFEFTGWTNDGFVKAMRGTNNVIDSGFSQAPGTTRSFTTPGQTTSGPNVCTMTALAFGSYGWNPAGFTWAPVIDGVAGSAAQITKPSWRVNVPSGRHSVAIKFSYQQGGDEDAYVVFDNLDLRCFAAPGAEDATSYEFKQGTSMAAPHVAGIVGLLASYEPGASTTQLRSAVFSSVDAVSALNPTSGSKPIATGGRVDANKALTAIDAAVAPDTEVTSVTPSSGVSNGSVVFAFSQKTTNAPLARFECATTDAGQTQSFSTCTSPFTATGTGTFTKTFSVRAVDTRGNADPSPATRAWTIDTIPPTVSITGGPAQGSIVTSSSPSFTFTAEAGATTECKLDASAYSNCTSPKSYTGLADGSHTFTVKATDAAGNTATASRTWTLYGAAPNTTIINRPNAAWMFTTAAFSFSSSQAGTFECNLDNAGFSACTSPRNYSGLAEGSHTFAVRAVNPASVVDPTPAQWTWTVDTVAPDTTITAAPLGTVSSATAQFSFISTESGTFECSLDGLPYASCTSPKSYTSLAEGSHSLRVRARDAATNLDATPATRTWTVDTVAPSVSITSGPATGSAVASSSATFAFSAEAGASVRCKLDSQQWGSCTSPITHSSLSDGSHTFSVMGWDAASNVATATRTWTVDTVAPDSTITAGPSGAVSSTSAQFSFTGTEVATFECSLDNAAFTSCTSPKSYAGLAQGAHAVRVRAVDAANNVDVTPATRTWTVDTVAPTITIANGPLVNSPSTSATFTFSSEPGATLDCKLDDQNYTPCSSPTSYTSLAEGTHTFLVRARDAAMNAGSTSRTWTVDTVAPDTTITEGPSGAVNSATVQFGFSSTEPGTFQCSLDGAVFTACTGPRVLESLSQGEHTFAVRAVDDLGNGDATPATRTWTVDATPPVITLSGPGDTAADTATITVAASEPVALECQIDGGVVTACVSPVVYAGLAPGLHTVSVWASDLAGSRVGPSVWTWTVERAADPVTPVPPAPANVTVGFPRKRVAAVSWQASAGASSYQVRISKRNSATRFGSWKSTAVTKASFRKLRKKAKYTVEVVAVGPAGTSSATKLTFRQRK